MFGDGDIVAGKDEIRPDVRQGLQHETAVRQPRVGENEDVVFQPSIAKVENVDIDDPRGIAFRGDGAAEVEFDTAGAVE